MNITSFKKLSAIAIMSILMGVSSLLAQKLSVTANISRFNINKIESETADIDYSGSTSLSINARIFTKKRWAYRFGVGLDKLNYDVGGGISTDYSARRNDLRGVVGVEKHFMLGNWIDIYPGAFIPIVVTGEDVISANLNNLENGDVRAGLGVLVGGNVSFLKILRLGVEFDATFDNFKNQVYESVEQTSFVPLKGINYNTTFTIGVML